MPTMQNAHIDRALTNVSVAYMQDAANFIADKVFPIVPVRRQSDLYYIYDRGDFMRDEARVRGAGTESAGGDYEVRPSDPYYCKKHALHRDVTEEERANYDEPLNVDIDTVDWLTQKMLIRREMEWANNFFGAGIWGRDITGVAGTPGDDTQMTKWNDPTSDPIKNITEAGVRVASLTAFRPNTLVLSPFVFNALKNHYDILDRIKYTQKGIVTNDLLATLFEVDRVLVPWAVVNSAPKNVPDEGEGTNEEINFITGRHALLCYSAPRPALKKPSAGYTFAWTGLMGASAVGSRIVRMPMEQLGLGTERIEAEMAFDMKVISKDLGVFFKDIV